ncbi:hypothetical protein BS50DRAFT_306596 [Corynespora cassiicola Philippines]|uniref:Uncharacterized protein n=1 Tax=Corynespora cassiicola Philippines TaxID=1448308 RepID=A0A2T2NYI9_CORCC|nr:hypothetical protein BS50DRAFT_306596 [Corynespora cassiicola Philippines]
MARLSQRPLVTPHRRQIHASPERVLSGYSWLSTHADPCCLVRPSSQPGADISQTRETSPPQGCATPPSTFPKFHPDEAPTGNDDTHLQISRAPATPRICKLRTPSRDPPRSPVPSANIGLHRSPRASLLLETPARPGHSARLRQLFENATLNSTSPSQRTAPLYPQLPNVSRTCSIASSKEGRKSRHLSAPSTVTPKDPPGKELLCDCIPFQKSSGRTSGGLVLEVDPHVRNSDPFVQSHTAIENWLTALPVAKNSECLGQLHPTRARHKKKGSGEALQLDHVGSSSTETIRIVHRAVPRKPSSQSPSSSSPEASLRHVSNFCKRLDLSDATTSH